MVVLDEDFGTNLTLVEGNGGVRLFPVSVPEHAPRDWRSQCERERARADAAEARAEELRRAEVAARSDGGSWKSRFKACRRRLSEGVEETKEARRAARDVPSLQAEVARLETLLSEAGIASALDTAGARSGGVEVYRGEDIELRAGDRARWTRNDAGLGLVNSQTAEVAAVAGAKVTFRLGDGRMLDLAPAIRSFDISTGHGPRPCMRSKAGRWIP